MIIRYLIRPVHKRVPKTDLGGRPLIGGGSVKVTTQEKILQVFDDGQWWDVPEVREELKKKNAKSKDRTYP